MLLWFIGGSLVIVWLVFQSPALDLRLVMVGSVLPLLEVLLGGPSLLHTLLGPVLVLAVVMAATVGRRVVRRRWLALPIGLFLHLVLDGSWADSQLFWWPLRGTELPSDGLPEFDFGWWTVLMELAGAAMIWWFVQRFDLRDPQRRALFLREGRIDRGLVEGSARGGSNGASKEGPPTC